MKIQERIKESEVLNTVQQLLEQQTRKGIEKYGQVVQSDNLTVLEWLNHLSEELTDSLIYLQALKENLQKSDELQRLMDDLDAATQKLIIAARTDTNVREALELVSGVSIEFEKML